MVDEEVFTPKDLEVLPYKIVHDIVQYGITYDSSAYNGQNENSSDLDSKTSKKYSPKNRKFKREALCSINRVASLFVLYITTVAESISRSNKRSTIFDKDILQALRQCMFWEVESQLSEESQNPESQSLNTNPSEADTRVEEDVDDDITPQDYQDDLDLDIEDQAPEVEDEDVEMEADGDDDHDQDDLPLDDENNDNNDNNDDDNNDNK